MLFCLVRCWILPFSICFVIVWNTFIQHDFNLGLRGVKLEDLVPITLMDCFYVLWGQLESHQLLWLLIINILCRVEALCCLFLLFLILLCLWFRSRPFTMLLSCSFFLKPKLLLNYFNVILQLIPNRHRLHGQFRSFGITYWLENGQHKSLFRSFIVRFQELISIRRLIFQFLNLINFLLLLFVFAKGLQLDFYNKLPCLLKKFHSTLLSRSSALHSLNEYA